MSKQATVRVKPPVRSEVAATNAAHNAAVNAAKESADKIGFVIVRSSYGIPRGHYAGENVHEHAIHPANAIPSLADTVEPFWRTIVTHRVVADGLTRAEADAYCQPKYPGEDRVDPCSTWPRGMSAVLEMRSQEESQ